jgi:hypothetical protein
MQQPKLMTAIKNEINKVVAEPYLKENGLKTLEFNKIHELLTVDSISDLTLMTESMLESLRLEPPIHYSTTHCFTEDV